MNESQPADVRAIQDALSNPFDPKEVKFKPQMVKNNRAMAMAYIDARLVCDRLDEVLGVACWQDRYHFLPDGSVVCRLSLKLGDRWITKTDVGSPSEQPDSGDRVKAAVSDALKRVAVKFGIGRYLYRLPAQWVDYDPVKKQLVQLPQLPAFAIPKKPAAPQQPKQSPPQPAEQPKSPTQQTQPPAAPPAQQPTPPAKPAVAASLPANGTELHGRLQEYDAKLAAQKLCVRGALLAHVSAAGVKAGYTANMTEWIGPAIPFAVEAVKEFEQSMRADDRNKLLAELDAERKRVGKFTFEGWADCCVWMNANEPLRPVKYMADKTRPIDVETPVLKALIKNLKTHPSANKGAA